MSYCNLCITLHCIPWQRGAEDAHADTESSIVRNAEVMESLSVRNAEGRESPIMRKPNTRAYLCELKSRRSPKRSILVRNAEGMESPIVRNAEGILIYLKNSVLSSKNDAGLAGV